MAVAEDLDRATDSQWDWVAEHTRTYLASGGTEGHESNGVQTRGAGRHPPVRRPSPGRVVGRARAALGPDGADLPLYDDYAQKTDRTIPIVLLTPQAAPGP
jgi:hypothetical protein